MADSRKVRVEVGVHEPAVPEPARAVVAPGTADARPSGATTEAAPGGARAGRGTSPGVGENPPDAAAVPEPAAGSAAGPEPASRFASWLGDAVPRNRYAVLGGAFGLVAALLLFSIGILKTVVIVVLVVAGVACGQYLDGDPKLVRLVQRLTRKR